MRILPLALIRRPRLPVGQRPQLGQQGQPGFPRLGHVITCECRGVGSSIRLEPVKRRPIPGPIAATA